MPVYSVKNTQTNEEFEVNMKFTEFQAYLEKNAKIKQIFRKFPSTVDPVSVGVTKTDSGFKDVLSKAKEAHWKNTIEY